MNVSHEVELLVEEMKRLGTVNSEGKHVVTFGTLFNDDKCANLFEGMYHITESPLYAHFFKGDPLNS